MFNLLEAQGWREHILLLIRTWHKKKKKRNEILVESIDQINSIIIEKKWAKIQNQLVEKQIKYFKIKYEVANCMQMAMGMAMI
jgi:hypothetical protein